MNTESHLAARLIHDHPDRAGAVLERVKPAEAVTLLARAPADDAARVIHRMSPLASKAVLERLETDRLSTILNTLDLDTCAQLVRRIDEERRPAVIQGLSSRKVSSLSTLLRFPENSAGALLDPNVLALADDLTAREALAQIRQAARNSHYNLYVVDRQGALVGALNLRELLLAAPRAHLSDLMVSRPFRLDAHATRAEVVAHPGWKVVHSLPVVDKQGHYVGVIRYGTLRALEDEFFTRTMADADTGEALGELLTVGVGGVLTALATSQRSTSRRS